MWTVLLVSVVTVLFLIRWIIQSRRDGYLSGVPGPAPWLIAGNIIDYFGLDQAEIFMKTREFAAQYGDKYKLKVFRRHIVNILNPDDAEIVLSGSRNIKKSFIYSFLSSWLQEGLLLSFGTKWHTRRKILTPAFHFNILKHFSSIMEDNSWKLVRQLELECLKDKTDITPMVSKFALNSICETAMGTQLDVDTSQAALDYKSAIMKMGHKLLERLCTFWLHSEWIYKMSPQGRQYQKLLDVIHRFPHNVIQDRKKFRKDNPSKTDVCNDDDDNDDVYITKKRRLAMLDLLLDAESQGEIDMNGIKEEVDTFMFEGHDTTAMAIAHTLMLLANHDDAQERVLSECERVFGGGDGGSRRPATMSDLSELRYLEACVKESLRLYPSVPFISRTMTEDIQLTDVLVKTGTTCHIHIYDIHRRADLFHQPNLFKPERFLAENLLANRHPYGYIPFSAGPRNCIGQRFAMLEMKCVVSAVVRSFHLHSVTTPADVVHLADLVLRPRDPVYVRFEKREETMNP